MAACKLCYCCCCCCLHSLLMLMLMLLHALLMLLEIMLLLLLLLLLLRLMLLLCMIAQFFCAARARPLPPANERLWFRSSEHAELFFHDVKKSLGSRSHLHSCCRCTALSCIIKTRSTLELHAPCARCARAP